MSAPVDQPPAQDETDVGSTPPADRLRELAIANVRANLDNPRLDFPQHELERLSQSIDIEGVLVPIVVYPEDDHFVLVDGERRFRCARDLGHTTIPAVVTTERSAHDLLVQMFNIHMIREEWRDIPTALALQRLIDEITTQKGEEPTDKELRELTGLSVDRIRQFRYIVTLPAEWQEHIRTSKIPMNFFWELKKNVIDPLRSNRPAIFDEYGEERVRNAFVEKRLQEVITDVVSLRKVAPIIRFAAQDANERQAATSEIDQSIRDLIEDRDATIEDAYDETVQLMVEVDKLSRRTNTMVAVFARLLVQTAGTEDEAVVRDLGRSLIDELEKLVGERGAAEADGSATAG